MSRPLVRSLAALLLCSLVTVQAQEGSANLPVRAVVAYVNGLMPELAAELEAVHTEPDDLAFALVERKVADATICPATAEPIKLAMTNGLLPHEAFVFYLADMINGTAACAPDALEVALAQLAEANVSVPLANSEGYITSETLDTALTGTGTSVSSSPSSFDENDESYDRPITPVAGQ